MMSLLSKRSYRLFQIEPTMRCNLQCVMCPWLEMRSPNADMAWETFVRIADSFKDVEEVDLTGGGEPLMHPQLLRMIALVKESGCRAGFSSNATLLSQDIADKLVDIGLDWIAYSIDGASTRTYEKIRKGASFDKVVENIRYLHQARRKTKDNKPLTLLFFIMMGDNSHEIPDVVDLCLELGIDRLVVKNQDVILEKERDRNRLFSWGSQSSDELNRIIENSMKKAKRNGLYMRVYELSPRETAVCEQDPLNTAFFNWEGFVSPCITLSYAARRIFRGKEVDAPIYRLGKINQESFKDIWGSPAYQQFRKCYKKRRRALNQGFKDLLFSGGFFRNIPDSSSLPPPPKGCETCNYLYGV